MIAGDCVEAIRDLSSFDSITFQFIPRQGNGLAHALAKNVVADDDGENVLPFDISCI